MLEAGTRLGPYEIVSPLGAGGMGEVYRARDTRLGREVAVKVLPQHLSSNPDVRARFEREAKTVSGLNHPNICTLFDVGREGDTDYLVMELIEGETLAERLRRGPLATPDLVRLGAQVADALDRAHRAGVVHRDLKPGNVMITRSGAKLMDFGLARGAGLAGGSGSSGASMAALTQSPTVAEALTAAGAIVGTFQYMSPEQLEGKEADTRSDIWALGCVLYEMATGRRAFEGRSQASLIAAILEREPAAIGEATSATSGSGAPSGPPQGLERLIRACLTKDPEERLQTAHDAKLQLQWIAEGAGLSSVGVATPLPSAGVPVVPVRRASARLPWIVAGVLLAALAAGFAWAWPRLTARPLVFRFNPDAIPPGTTDSYWPRVSPDGRSIVFQAQDSSNVARAWLMRLDETQPHVIPGTDGLQRAYWSPDSKEIAFVAQGKIQRVAVAGGSPTMVCAAPGGADLSWGARGMLLLDGQVTDSLRVVPAAGGELKPATRISREEGETGSAWPSFLPDGEHFLFIGTRLDGKGGNIRLGKLGTMDSRLLGSSDGRAEYAPGGWVLFVQGTSLVAQKLDMRAQKLTGERITLIDDLSIGNSRGHFSASASGVVVFKRGAAGGGRELHMADRAGLITPAVLARGTIGNPRISPDGDRVLYERKSANNLSWGDLFVLDRVRGTDTRLTFTDGRAVSPQWSPDGRRFAYSRASANGRSAVVIGSADGLGAEDSSRTLPAGSILTQWAEAGSVFAAHDGTLSAWAVPAEGADLTARRLLDSTIVMVHPRISPDGRWLAGVQGTPADYHVFVVSLQGPPGRWQISSTLGSRPIWTKGGKELLYETPDGRVMAVNIDTSHGFAAGLPQTLMSLPVPSYNVSVASWGCDAQGEQFVVVTNDRTRTASRAIEVVSDFRALVNRK